MTFCFNAWKVKSLQFLDSMTPCLKNLNFSQYGTLGILIIHLFLLRILLIKNFFEKLDEIVDSTHILNFSAP